MTKIQEAIVYFALLNVKMVKFDLPRLSAQGNLSYKVKLNLILLHKTKKLAK